MNKSYQIFVIEHGRYPKSYPYIKNSVEELEVILSKFPAKDKGRYIILPVYSNI